MSRYTVNFDKTKYSFWGIAAALVTALTIFSQMPAVVSRGMSSSISRAIWIGFFSLILLIKRDSLKIRRVTIAFVTVGCYILFVLIASLLSPSGGYRTSLFNSVLLSFFILMVGLLIGKDITEQDMYLCGRVYVLATVLLAIVLYFDVYRGYNISNVVYAYSAKNSAGVILFTGALIAFVYGWERGKRFVNLINFLIIAFLVYMVLIMKVRAMIVCIPVVALCAVLRAPFRRKVRVPLLLACVALLIALQFDAVYDVLINNILFAGRGDDFASASSGRTEQWVFFFQNLQGKELFGDGKTEQESLILTAFLQCGLFMGTLIIAYAAWPVTWALRRTKRMANKHFFLLLLVAVTYFIDAVFEMLAPFGPGARCFYLWLIFGFSLAKGEGGVFTATRGERS